MIVADTSALISLATAELVELVSEEFDVHTTETVIEELQATANYDDVSGTAASALIEEGHGLTVHAVDFPKFESSRIDRGEGSCAVVTREIDADFLVTDDLRALPELQTASTARVAISPIVLEALVERGVLTREQAKENLEQIAADRDWLESPIYRRAENILEE